MNFRYIQRVTGWGVSCQSHDHTLYAPENLVQPFIIVSVSGIETIDSDTIVFLPLGMYILVVVERQSYVRNPLATKENQVAFPWLASLNAIFEEIKLLVRIAREQVTA